MVEIRFTRHTTVTPERVMAAATDFTARRPDVWPNLDPARYRVLATANTTAEAMEGSKVLGGIWARERYDWSRPGVVRAEVADSNVFAAGSSWELHVQPIDGGSSVEWVSVRHPRGFKGRVLVAMLSLAGRRKLEEDTRPSGAVHGPHDPEVAVTLGNLGIVQQLLEAEDLGSRRQRPGRA